MHTTLKSFGRVFEKYCQRFVASEMGGLVPSLLASNSLNVNQYSTRKGFSQTREKVVDLKRKKFGGSSSAKLCC